MPPSAELRALALRVERLLLPAECLLCREPVPASDVDALACAICRSRWARVAPPLCTACGATTEREAVDRGNNRLVDMMLHDAGKPPGRR